MSISPFLVAPLLQVIAILYLTYLVVFRKYKGLSLFFIIFGISAAVAMLSYNMLGKQQQMGYARLWYNCDIADIILCVIGIVFS